MKAYLAIKFKEDQSNRKLIEDVSASLAAVGVETYVMARDFEKWGAVKNVWPDVLMAHTFRAINEADIVVVEFSEKGVGLGIEAGYAFAQRKPIIVVAKEGSDISSTLRGIAKRILFYKNHEDLEEGFGKMNVQAHGTNFLIMRPDKTVLMQLRDQNSKRYKGLWCFPGGECEEGEAYLDTVVREVKEEYDLVVKKEDCSLLMTRTLNKIHVFVCHIDDVQQPVLYEGADMKWMSIDEIQKLMIGYNHGDIVAQLGEYLRTH